MRIPDRVSATLFISVRAFEFSRPKFPLFHPERGGATSLRSVCVSAFSCSILSFNRADNAVTTTSKLAWTFQRHFASWRMLNSSRDSRASTSLRVLRSSGTFHAAENSGQSRTTSLCNFIARRKKEKAEHASCRVRGSVLVAVLMHRQEHHPFRADYLGAPSALALAPKRTRACRGLWPRRAIVSIGDSSSNHRGPIGNRACTPG